MVEQINIKGKVIVPLPDLIAAMANNKFHVDGKLTRSALYAPAFISLVGNLKENLTISKNSKTNSWNWLPHDKMDGFMGYAVLDSFETYHIVPMDQDVTFTLGDGSNWVRPYSFGLYSGKSAMFNSNMDLIYRKGYHDIEYESVEVSSKVVDSKIKNDTELIISDMNSQNIRTTNAFISKFGVKLDNPYLQSILDSGVNMLEGFVDQSPIY